MADGGDPMGKEKEDSEAAKPVSMTETAQSSSVQMTRESVSEKMFWWGGYY
jgi:hypothetical protein